MVQAWDVGELNWSGGHKGDKRSQRCLENGTVRAGQLKMGLRVTPAYLRMPFVLRGTYLRSRAKEGQTWAEQTAWPHAGVFEKCRYLGPNPTTIKCKRFSLTGHLVSCRCWSLHFSRAFPFTQFNLPGTNGILIPSAPEFVNGDPWVSGICGDWMCMQSLMYVGSFLGRGPVASYCCC